MAIPEDLKVYDLTVEEYNASSGQMGMVSKKFVSFEDYMDLAKKCGEAPEDDKEEHPSTLPSTPAKGQGGANPKPTPAPKPTPHTEKKK